MQLFSTDKSKLIPSQWFQLKKLKAKIYNRHYEKKWNKEVGSDKWKELHNKQHQEQWAIQRK